MASQTTQNFSVGALALLLPLIRTDIPMTFTQAGLLSVLLTISYAVMQVPAGLLGDRIGVRRAMVIGLVGLNLVTVAMALVPGYGLLAATLVLLGALRALAFAPGLALITDEFGPDRRATAMSMFMASGFVTNLLLSLTAPLLVEPLGWRGVIAAFGVAGLIPVAAYLLSSRGVAPPGRGGDRSALPVRGVMFDPVVALACVVQFTRLGVTMAVRFWLPSYLVVERGFSLATTAVVVAVVSAVSIATTLLGGHVSDRGQRPVLVIICSLAALTVALPLFTTAKDPLSVMVVTAAIYVFVQAYSGPLFEVPLRVFGNRGAATLNGIGNGWANIGGLVTTFALGRIADVTGSFLLGWWAMAALCFVALIAAIGMGGLARRRTAPGSNLGPARSETPQEMR